MNKTREVILIKADVKKIRKRDVFWVLSRTQIEHVVQDIDVCPVPFAPPYIRGVAAWQNMVLPVLSLERFFGFSPVGAGTVKRRIVVKTVADSEPRTVKRLLIDNVHEVRVRPLTGPCMPVRMSGDQSVVRGLGGAFEWDVDKLLLLPELSLMASGHTGL